MTDKENSLLLRLERFLPVLIFGFLAFAVLWKGGKSLETTWLLVGIAWLASVVTLLRRPAQTLPLWLWSFGILFVLWTILSYLRSATGNYGLDEVLRDGALLLLCFWSARETAQQKDGLAFTQQLLRTLAYVTIAACVVGLAVYVLQPVNRFVGTFFDFRFHTDYWPNAWAEWLLLGWPAVLLWYRGARTHAALRFFLLALPLSSLLLSYSRGALIAFAGQLVLLALLRWRAGQTLRPQTQSLRTGVILVLTVLVLCFGANLVRGRFFAVQDALQKATFTAAEGASSISERQQFWQQSLALWSERPWLGWGPSSFRFVQPRLQTTVLATSDHPHNALLKIGMERGAPAALLWLVFVGSILGWTLVTGRFSKDRGIKDPQQATSDIIVVAVAGVLAHNLIDYNLQFVGIALPLWLLLGVLLGRLPAVALSRVSSHSVLAFESVLASVFLFIAAIEGGYLVTSSLGRHAEARGDTVTALRWYDRSLGERFSRDLHLSRAHLLLEGKRFADAIAAADRSLDQNEVDGRAWKLLADACAANRDYVCALDAYEQAYRLHRFNDLSVTHSYLLLLRSLGLEPDSTADKPAVDALLQAFTEAIERNAHFVALSPNVEAALALSRDLAAWYPEEEPTYVMIGAAVERASRAERAKIEARRPGFLW